MLTLHVLPEARGPLGQRAEVKPLLAEQLVDAVRVAARLGRVARVGAEQQRRLGAARPSKSCSTETGHGPALGEHVLTDDLVRVPVLRRVVPGERAQGVTLRRTASPRRPARATPTPADRTGARRRPASSGVVRKQHAPVRGQRASRRRSGPPRRARACSDRARPRSSRRVPAPARSRDRGRASADRPTGCAAPRARRRDRRPPPAPRPASRGRARSSARAAR